MRGCTRLPVVLVVAGAVAGALAPGAAAGGGEQPAAARNRFGYATPKPRPEGSIRIATYNVLNLFDDKDDPSLSGEHDDYPQRTSDDRCRGIAAAIREVDADVIAMQEVESLEALEWFRDTYLPDAGYAYVASVDAGYYRGVECSVMSRYEITGATVWPGESLDDVVRTGIGWDEVPADHGPLAYQRSPLMVDIDVAGYELTLFVLHHKAGRDFNFHREAEALRTMAKVRERIERDPSRNVIVLGDFNAAPWDRSLRVYLEGGMIDAMAHRTTYRSNPETPLYITHESHRVLDYILLNSAAHRELVIGSPHVYGTLFDEDYDWKKDPFPAGYAADHYPVILDLIPHDVP